MRPPAFRLALLLIALFLAGCSTSSSPPSSDTSPQDFPEVGPATGSLIVAGGGQLGPEIWARFLELAGGHQARIVVIPTADASDEFPENWAGILPLLEAGAAQVTILHTRDPAVADSPIFTAPLESATGVWIPGGRQWRLVDAYLDTRTHGELRALLERGGVVGGTSAGASIQGSYLVRGDPETNQVLMAPGYEEGFGFLSGTAVDQHLLARGRENDLWELLDREPHLLGIGVDEGTALVVQGDRAEVIGTSQVLIYDSATPLRQPLSLRAGSVFDLGERRSISSTVAPEDAGRETLR